MSTKNSEVNYLRVTERELRESEGYLRIYDAGHAKFKWNVS